MKYFLYSIISGALYGLCSIALKILSEKSMLNLVLNPLFLLSFVVGSIAFVLNQISLKNLKSSHVTLVIVVFSTTVSIIGSIFLGEFISIYGIIGIILMTGSITFLMLKQ